MSGQEITFEVNGRSAAGYLSLPSASEAPGVIVLHAWWGLNPFFKRLCDRLAVEGFAAFAPDLNEGKVAKTIEEAKELMASLDERRKYDVAIASIEFLRGQPEIRKEPFSIIGFSMGAAWSLLLASKPAEDIDKAVLFYGAGEGNFAQIRAKILGHYSDTDEWEDIDYVRSMENDMRKAGLDTTFHIYPQLPHWFFEDDRPEFDPESAELAWRRTLEFLRG